MLQVAIGLAPPPGAVPNPSAAQGLQAITDTGAQVGVPTGQPLSLPGQNSSPVPSISIVASPEAAPAASPAEPPLVASSPPGPPRGIKGPPVQMAVEQPPPASAVALGAVGPVVSPPETCSDVQPTAPDLADAIDSSPAEATSGADPGRLAPAALAMPGLGPAQPQLRPAESGPSVESERLKAASSLEPSQAQGKRAGTKPATQAKLPLGAAETSATDPAPAQANPPGVAATTLPATAPAGGTTADTAGEQISSPVLASEGALSASVQSHRLPTATARDAGGSSFVAQLQAVAAFAEPMERPITARLSAHRDEDSSRLTIELDPAELGPVEVALRLDDRGTAAATFVADRPETLQLLQRDTRALVDLLAGAGFTLDGSNLEFQLRDGQQQMQQQRGGQATPDSEETSRLATGRTPASATLTHGRGLLDLRV